MRRGIAVVMWCSLLSCPGLLSGQAPSPAPVTNGKQLEIRDVQAMMESDDLRQRVNAIPHIRQLLITQPKETTKRLSDEWIGRLIDVQQYDAAADLGRQASMLVVDDDSRARALQTWQISLLIVKGNIDESVAETNAMLAAHPDWASDLADHRDKCPLRLLLSARKFAAADEVSQQVLIRSAGSVVRLETVLQLRIQALLGLRKTKEALVAAKQLYGVCRMEKTKDAIRTLSECLDAAHPEDRDILARFKSEQIAGAEPTTSRPSPAIKTVFSEIVIDPAPYETERAKLCKEEFESLSGRGNLLLLAGCPDEAWNLFMRAYAVAGDGDLQWASECLARCMKAQDGSIGRANAWVLSIRPKSKGAAN